MLYKIRETAQLAGITVRTLHYYDEIGLLTPHTESASGYRLYNEDDLLKLQQILFFRELGFSLKKIKEMMEHPGFDRIKALESQKKILIRKKERLNRIIRTIDKSLRTTEGDKTMKANEMFNAFDMTDIEEHQKKYAREVEQRWGQSDAYKESQQKARQYSKDDWKKIMDRGNTIYREIARLMDKGPQDPLVQEQVAAWQKHISDSFYQCSSEMLRGLGTMYVTDPRFTKNIDKVKQGLADFLKKAIDYYCDQKE